MSEDEISIMKPRMKGLPFIFEHDKNKVKVGEILSTYSKPDGSWHAKVEVDDSTLTGLNVARDIRDKMLHGLSLCHYRELDENGGVMAEPEELSLCWEGAREGTGIDYEDDGEHESKDESYIPNSDTRGYYTGARTQASLVCASSWAAMDQQQSSSSSSHPQGQGQGQGQGQAAPLSSQSNGQNAALQQQQPGQVQGQVDPAQQQPPVPPVPVANANAATSPEQMLEMLKKDDVIRGQLEAAEMIRGGSILSNAQKEAAVNAMGQGVAEVLSLKNKLAAQSEENSAMAAELASYKKDEANQRAQSGSMIATALARSAKLSQKDADAFKARFVAGDPNAINSIGPALIAASSSLMDEDAPETMGYIQGSSSSSPNPMPPAQQQQQNIPPLWQTAGFMNLIQQAVQPRTTLSHTTQAPVQTYTTMRPQYQAQPQQFANPTYQVPLRANQNQQQQQALLTTQISLPPAMQNRQSVQASSSMSHADLWRTIEKTQRHFESPENIVRAQMETMRLNTIQRSRNNYNGGERRGDVIRASAYDPVTLKLDTEFAYTEDSHTALTMAILNGPSLSGKCHIGDHTMSRNQAYKYSGVAAGGGGDDNSKRVRA